MKPTADLLGLCGQGPLHQPVGISWSVYLSWHMLVGISWSAYPKLHFLVRMTLSISQYPMSPCEIFQVIYLFCTICVKNSWNPKKTLTLSQL